MRDWRIMRVSPGLLKAACALLAVLTNASSTARAAEKGVDYVSDLVVVAPTTGPAWWKATKGSTVVWILGLPPLATSADMAWDRAVLKRRLKGAGLLVMPAVEYSAFPRDETPPMLSREVGEKVAAAYEKNGLRYYGVLSVATGLDLPYRYKTHYRLTYDARKDIAAEARRARVKIAQQPTKFHDLVAADLTMANPQVVECMSAIVDFAQTPPDRLRLAGRQWAVGDVRGMLENSPLGMKSCSLFWSGHQQRMVEFQTDAIIQAMEASSKVIAVAPIASLVAPDGILVRLRAKGYVIADPTKPLEE